MVTILNVGSRIIVSGTYSIANNRSPTSKNCHRHKFCSKPVNNLTPYLFGKFNELNGPDSILLREPQFDNGSSVSNFSIKMIKSGRFFKTSSKHQRIDENTMFTFKVNGDFSSRKCSHKVWFIAACSKHILSVIFNLKQIENSQFGIYRVQRFQIFPDNFETSWLHSPKAAPLINILQT